MNQPLDLVLAIEPIENGIEATLVSNQEPILVMLLDCDQIEKLELTLTNMVMDLYKYRRAKQREEL